ncbi:MAG TPA: Ku protein [Actinomycetales bacterium]|nr:Ku protein [Actinomycetales bacterium]
MFLPPVASAAQVAFDEDMRAIWSGSIAFGLVNVPVKAYTAVREHDLKLHQVHDKDHGRIRYERRCDVCGELVEYSHIQRAFDDGSTTVVLTDEDLKELPAAARGEIEVVRFVPSQQIDPITLDGSYYLQPDSKATKAYALLLHTLNETERTAIVTFALRQKTRLGVLRVREGDLVLQSMTWPDEVREQAVTDLGSVKLTKKEKDLAATLVDHMTGDFDPDEFEDEYQIQLRELIEAKLEAGDAVDTAATFGEGESEEPDRGKVVDLMEALQRSIDKGKAKGA